MAVSLAASGLGGCDCFFDLQGVVSNCDNRAPIEDAHVAVTVTNGYGGRSYVLDRDVRTDRMGRFSIHLNEPCDSRVTFTVTKAAYQPVTIDQEGARGVERNLCLSPAASP